MGFFSSSIEEKLEKLYISMFQNMGMSISDARATVSQMLEDAKENVRKNGESQTSKEAIEYFLTDEKFSKKLEILRADGVKDDDIRWWLKMQPLERQMMLKMDELNKTVLMMNLVEEGKEMDEAERQVRKYHPVFGDSLDEKNSKGQDRPIPEMLKDRINIYIENRVKSDLDQYKKDIEESSSFNALIRKEVVAKKL
ncbi:MAG: hypothetical protein WC719_00030 [Patescibacteria group bacterium]|jgi:hypothetical protein